MRRNRRRHKKLLPVFKNNFPEKNIIAYYDAAGNATKIEGYNNFSGIMELTTTFDLTYDDKINPLSVDQQIMLISGGAPGSAVNNIIVAKFKDVANPDVQTITNTYTF